MKGFVNKGLFIMEKSLALLNATAVWQSATLFGHGDIIDITFNGISVEICVHLPYDRYDYEREKDWYMQRVICGARFKKFPRPDLHRDCLHIIWNIDQNHG